jgi:ribonuclease VapC
MVIDASAVLAIVFGEPEAERMAAAIVAAPQRLMSTVNLLEAVMVVQSRYGDESADDVYSMLRELEVEAVPFDVAQMKEACEAWRRYGRGRHRARLNMGDCCAYAAALTLEQALLFKGADFPLTDIAAASW